MCIYLFIKLRWKRDGKKNDDLEEVENVEEGSSLINT